ncbi:MAG: hypothetical protein JSS50_02665 [Proteobacteria bacterium]|nr:hypothetical protein [Pseudomonadota bacterium]
MQNLFTYIMAGGDGKRLWPVSKPELPKQFLSLNDSMSMLQLTILRHAAQCNPITVLTTNKYQVMVMGQSHIVHDDIRLIIEQKGGGTLLVAIIAALDALQQHQEPYVLLVPSDQYISDMAAYEEAILRCVAALETQDLLLMGVPVEAGYTGYGYIEPGVDNEVELEHIGATPIAAFYEKPAKEVLQTLIAKKSVLWSTGIFVFKARKFLEWAAIYEATYYNIAFKALKSAFCCENQIHLKNYENLESTPSIDSTLCSKIDNKAVIRLNSGWYDLGSWFGIKRWLDVMPQNAKKPYNKQLSHVHGVYLEAQKCFFIAGESVLAIGMSEIAVMEGEELKMLLDLSTAKEIIPRWQRQNTEIDSMVVVNEWERRPWGYIKTLAVQPKVCVVKELCIEPGAQTSLQYHKFREEHMLAISGNALFCVEDNLIPSIISKYVHIPQFHNHRIKNVGDTDLLILEIQVGEYIDEDDIVRVADDYGRV